MSRTRALLSFAWLTWRLNWRSRQAILYGYAMPVFFLLAFSALFRGGHPPLLAQIGQVLVISALGGACFGLPTALVAEREEGVWRRHALLPVSYLWILGSVLLVRLLLVASAGALQILLAHLVFGTPWPSDVWLFGAVYLFVISVFLGIGLVVAALAENVPAVQAIGQCLFLPMIILGGVGVPLSALPGWAQAVSSFMPGRYAVLLLQGSYEGRWPVEGPLFSLLSLAGIGAAAFGVGLLLFRIDRQKASVMRRLTALAALLPWLVVGALAWRAGEWRAPRYAAAYETVRDEDIRAIRYDDLPGDDEFVAPIGPALIDDAGGPHVQAIVARLGTWAPANTGDIERDIRAMLSLAGLADLAQDARERDFARATYVMMRARYTRQELRRVLAWIVLAPKYEPLISLAPEMGVRRKGAPDAVEHRARIYARKFLGRVEGALQD